MLGLAFLLATALRTAGDSESIINTQIALRQVLDGPLLHTRLARNIALFVAAQVLLHCLFGAIIFFLAKLSRLAWPGAAISRNQWLLLWFILSAVWILIANASLFPWSLLGQPYAEILRASQHGLTSLRVYSCVASAAILITLLRALYVGRGRARALHTARPKMTLWLSAALLLLIVGPILLYRTAPANSDASRPNVILIGIDALRADVPGTAEHWTPAIDEFLTNSVRFSNAITPLARTFPSWIATLSGRYPRNTGAIINLLPRDLIDTGETLPEALRRAGYRTTFAIDEARFANIDASYGFDRVVSPPPGASDFLLGSINDVPLANLTINTRLGSWLFPYSYGNRAAAVTYQPETFVRRLRRELSSEGPQFIAIHLTLAHWPFYWATAPNRDIYDESDIPNAYRMSVERVDRQFAALMNMLTRKGLLENAVVVLFSDHGEAIGIPADRPYDDPDLLLRGASSMGHGTSVLSPFQYRVVLGIRSYGAHRMRATTLNEPVSLVDMAPTLLDLVNASTVQRFDGISLAPLVLGTKPNQPSFHHRIRYTETEFNPRGFQPGKTLTASALSQITTLYELDAKTDRIEIRPERLDSLRADRQYAATQGELVLAAIPNTELTGFRFVLADNRQRRVEEFDPMGAHEERVSILWNALAKHLPRPHR